MGKKSTAAIYGAVHFLVDMGCAFFVFRMAESISGFYVGYLIYNFLAFALQMPVGLIADRLRKNSLTASVGCILVGCALFCVFVAESVWLGLFLAGIGNCLFHVGGGIEVMRKSGGKAAPLGIFVSPGAIGIFVGTLLGKNNDISVFWAMLPLLLTAVCLVIFTYGKKNDLSLRRNEAVESADKVFFGGNQGESGRLLPPEKLFLAIGAMSCFFLVVVLRSYLGMIAVFPWKDGLFTGILCLMAVVGGKIAGGFLADKAGVTKAVIVSMMAAALLFVGSDRPILGVLALLCFNMSMPVTLYLADKLLRNNPGFAFGILTFAIFLGFLPAYAGYTGCSNVILAVLAAGSLLLMISGIFLYNKWK